MTVLEVEERLNSNLKRVETLVKLFDDSESGGSPTETDLLRAAVVFLHATLEDVVRSGLELRLPNAAPEHLSMLRFAVRDEKQDEVKARDKISVSELAEHRGKTVDELIDERISAYLKRSNFNNIAELNTALRRMALDTSIINPYKPDIITMMTRRHLIVHRADYDEGAAGSGQPQTPRSLSVKTVTAWENVVSE